MSTDIIPGDILNALKKGVVIPALPLALDINRKFDERRQRALIRYYLDAGAGGIAVAVHTTQFAIRLPEVGLFEPLLGLAAEEFDMFTAKTGKPVIRISGVIGLTPQAIREAEAAHKYGYYAVLLSLAAFAEAPNSVIIEHCKAIAEIMPVVGFYLQPAVGGRVLDRGFWREFARIENVVAIKIAPFNRYNTLDVVRGVVESGRADEIALYTGNDDNILVDLLTEFEIAYAGRRIRKRITGGLLGHWAVWTRNAVRLLDDVHAGKFNNDVPGALTLAARITDSNAAFFDAANNFKGCIAGIHEVLRRQGLLEGVWTLDRDEGLSPGQKEEIDRVYRAYPE
ncbi:MAG TPA: dihydrodipicolinate synthase family protein, partial [Bacteroidales bacterium]|nr:dihydrodipicolinate synthase family protein [Bacteroidales bacterium]